MRIVRVAAVILVLGLLSGPLAAQQGGWTPLFNGKDLSGWYQCNGTAPYAVENGDILGGTIVNSPSSFLCSKEKHGDFILEYDVWVDTNFNSGVGEWNRARIVVQGRHVEHWLNGFKTVEYERGTQMWRALVNYSKYVVWPGFGEAPRGHILLQDHGNRVSFRTIKLRELK